MYQDTFVNRIGPGNIPVIKMDLFDMAKQMTGRSDIESIEFIDVNTGIIKSRIDYRGNGDFLPSVMFRSEEIFDSYSSDDFSGVKHFPGVV